MCHAKGPEIAEGAKIKECEIGGIEKKEKRGVMLRKRHVIDSTDLQFNQWGASVN